MNRSVEARSDKEWRRRLAPTLTQWTTNAQICSEVLNEVLGEKPAKIAVDEAMKRIQTDRPIVTRIKTAILNIGIPPQKKQEFLKQRASIQVAYAPPFGGITDRELMHRISDLVTQRLEEAQVASVLVFPTGPSFFHKQK